MKNLLLFIAIAGLLVARCPAEKIDLAPGKSIHLVLPDSWTNADTATPQPVMPTPAKTGRYVTKNGSNDALLITILTVPDERFNDSDNLKALVGEATEQFVAGSVEGQADLKEIKLGGVAGYAATFTDVELVGKPSEKENYKAVTSCYAYLGEHVLVTATIFTDDLTGKAYAEAMRILKTLSLDLSKDAL
jgi:hypothetical protein